jgi:cyanophycinase
VTDRTFALLGSGEFEPWTSVIDAWLLDRAGGDGSVLIVPTAAAREGDEVFHAWAAKGLAHFSDGGIPARALPLKDRSDAERDELAEELERASIVYFSGGNPWYLAETLRDSSFCRVMLARLDDGLAYAGCSAGVACLTEQTFDSDTEDLEQVFKPGLAYARPGVLFGPHWDMLDAWAPGARAAIEAAAGEDGVLVGIDEDTALLGDGTGWTVAGRQAVHVRADGAWSHHPAGSSFELPLLP